MRFSPKQNVIADIKVHEKIIIMAGAAMRYCRASRYMYDLLFCSVWFCYCCATCNRHYNCSTIDINTTVGKRVSQ